MRKITCVTFPRSGHHMMINVLLKYFSGNLNYLETGGDKTESLCFDVLRAGNLQYCEFYKHCKQTPCTDILTNFQKNHDFDLKLQPRDDAFYIVLYRNPLDTIVSNYNYHLSGSVKDFFSVNINNNKAGWVEVANKNIIFWRDFVRKWIIGKQMPNRLFISYEEMLEFPLISFINIIKFIEPNVKIDLNLLASAIKKVDIEKKHDIRQFQYYSESFFAELEKSVLNEIKALGLDAKFN